MMPVKGDLAICSSVIGKSEPGYSVCGFHVHL